MAKPKKSVLVEQLPPGFIRVWCDTPNRWISEILELDGITFIDNLSKNVGCLMLHCDPRYDIAELCKEVSDLLKAEVPSVFRD